MSRFLDPQTPPEKAFRGSKHLLTRHLVDFGRLGKKKHLQPCLIFFFKFFSSPHKPTHPCHQGFTDAVTQMYLSSGVQPQDVTTPMMGHLVQRDSWRWTWQTCVFLEEPIGRLRIYVMVDCGLCMVILMLEAMWLFYIVFCIFCF